MILVFNFVWPSDQMFLLNLLIDHVPKKLLQNFNLSHKYAYTYIYIYICLFLSKKAKVFRSAPHFFHPPSYLYFFVPIECSEKNSLCESHTHTPLAK